MKRALDSLGTEKRSFFDAFNAIHSLPDVQIVSGVRLETKVARGELVQTGIVVRHPDQRIDVLNVVVLVDAYTNLTMQGLYATGLQEK